MAEAVNAEAMAYAQDVLLNERYDQEVQQFVELLGIFEPEVQRAGTAIYQSTITGTIEEYVDGEDVKLSKYTETLGDPYVVEIKPIRKRTTQNAIQKSGYYNAVTKTDNAVIKDVRLATMTEFFDALENGTSTAVGTDFKKALINAGAKLATVMESKGDTAILPVYFANRQDYADWAGDATVANDGQGSVFGMNYILNLAGQNGITFLTGWVDSGTIYATEASNLHIYVPDYEASEEGGLTYEISDMGVIATHHKPSYEGNGVETFVNAGMLIIPEFVDYIVGASISSDGSASAAGYPDNTPDETWSVKQLKAFAADNDIDLTGASNKTEILAAITTALSA